MSNFYLVVSLPPVVPEPTRQWPVVGRRVELAQLAAMVADAASGGALRGVVLHGPAGIGKTALASRAAAAAAELGFVTERLVAGSGIDVPLMWLAPLRRPGSNASSRMELLQELELVISERSPDRPMVVVLDDAPLLEPADAELVSYLARRGLLILIATARAGEPGLATFTRWFVDGSFTRMEVGPLDPSILTAAAEEFLDGRLHPGTAAELRRVSHGVPLFAREFLAANLARGALVSGPNGWQLVAEAAVPATLIELVSARYSDLDEQQLRYLETLAMAQPLPADFRPAAMTASQLAGLEDAGLVVAAVERGGTVVRLAHPLYGEAILARTGPLRRHEIAGRAVAALEHLPVGDPDRELRIAALCVEHDLPLDPELAVGAAQRALNALDPALAERVLARVDVPSWSSQFVLGTALAVRGRIDDADRELARAMQLADTDEQRARAASRRANCLGTGGGRFEDAMLVLDDAAATLADPHWQAFLGADRAYLQLAMGDLAPVRIQSDATGQVRANECLVGAVIAALSGRFTDAEAFVTEGLELVEHLVPDVPTARELLNLSRFIVLCTSGRAAAAAGIVTTELQRSGGRSAVAGSWYAMQALQRLVDGDATAAASEAARAAAELVEVDISTLRPFVLGIQATALAQLNRAEEAGEVLAAIDPAWRDETKARLMMEQAESWRLVMAGKHGVAASRLTRAGKVALDAQHAPLAMMAVHDAARFGHPSVALPVLREAAQQVEGRLVQALLEHATALDVGDPDVLLALADELPELGFTVSAAESAVTAARLLDRAGRRTDAAQARAVAARLLEPLGDVRTPALGTLVVLTGREREVAEMAAQRHRSREIAAQLGISVRTVDNHLVAVYRKLGVTSRDQLQRVLAQRP